MKEVSKHVAKTQEDTNTFLQRTPSARNSFQGKSDTASEPYTRSKFVMKTKFNFGVG